MKWEYVVYVAMLTLCAGIIFLLVDAKNACESGGGKYVRGLYGYECI